MTKITLTFSPNVIHYRCEREIRSRSLFPRLDRATLTLESIMANLFVLNLDGTIAPVAADKNCNALIAHAVSILAGDSDVPSAPEPIDVDARRAALFGEVTSGALSMDDAVAALKALDAEVVAAAKAAKADPPVLLLAGTPATAAEVKRAFRGAESGTSVEVASLDDSRVGTITMFRV